MNDERGQTTRTFDKKAVSINVDVANKTRNNLKVIDNDSTLELM